MQYRDYRCSICGVVFTLPSTYWVCMECSKEHDLHRTELEDWPEWASFLQREEDSRRKRMVRGQKEYREIVFSDLSWVEQQRIAGETTYREDNDWGDWEDRRAPDLV